MALHSYFSLSSHYFSFNFAYVSLLFSPSLRSISSSSSILFLQFSNVIKSLKEDSQEITYTTKTSKATKKQQCVFFFLSSPHLFPSILLYSEKQNRHCHLARFIFCFLFISAFSPIASSVLPSLSIFCCKK